MNTSLRKLALVTGASGGIGKAMAASARFTPRDAITGMVKLMSRLA
ncbi:MAG: hypothetical protein ACRES4_06310 [Nevskiales bacterium]